MTPVRQVRYPPVQPRARTSPSSSEEEPRFGGRRGSKAWARAEGAAAPGSPDARIDRGCFQGVRLPVTPADVRAAQSLPEPCVPDCFATLAQYRTVLTAAVVRQLQLQLADLSERVCAQLAKCGPAPAAPAPALSSVAALAGTRCRHGLEYSRVLTVRKEGPNQGRQFVTCPKDCFHWLDGPSSSPVKQGPPQPQPQKEDEVSLKQLGPAHEEPLRRNADVSFMARCEVSTMDTYMREHSRGGRGGGRQFDSPFGGGGGGSGGGGSSSSTVYLTVTRKEPSSCYAKDDVWVLFPPGQPERQALFRATFHGPNRSLEVEMAALSPRVPFPLGPQLTSVCALHGPNFSSELKELETLAALSVERFPLLPFVLNPPAQLQLQGQEVLPSRADQRFQAAPVERLVAQEHLNEDQARVLRDIVRVALDERPVPPVTLVHGVFGSGKSTVLSSALRVLDYLIESLVEGDAAAHSQILFAATTNAAVDRVLTDLFQRGFTSFLRVGSRRRIAKELFPFTLHCLASDEDDVRDMRDMLARAQSPDDARCIQQEIDAVRAGQMRKRRELLSTVRVVGATCTACTFDVLARRRFRVVVMDECSQTTEPTSLLALANFSCERAVLVGDPQQLPPVLSHSRSVADDSPGSSAAPQGLAKTLFERLAHSGVAPIMLRTQYRCHPTISGIANRLFYAGQLRDGVDAAARPPVVPGLPPVVLCRGDAGCERTDGAGSVYNEHEARAAATLLAILVRDHDVAPDRIGVICLYRAQAAAVRRFTTSDPECAAVPVSTVDAFQGEERDVIILSVARTAQLGFADSPKRLNVAITRARRHLILIAHQGLLARNDAWRALLQPALDAQPAGVQDCARIIATRSLSIPSLSCD